MDASASEAGRTPAADLLALHEELRLYDEELLQKPALVLANKYDLDGEFMILWILSVVHTTKLTNNTPQSIIQFFICPILYIFVIF